MKLQIQWENGDSQVIKGVEINDSCAKAVLDAKIFQTVQWFPNCLTCIDLRKARLVRLIEDNDE